MSTVISYLDYVIPAKGMPIQEFIDTLDDDYISNWCKSFLGSEIRRKDVAHILTLTTKIDSIHIGLGDNENESMLFKNLLIPYFEQNGEKQIDYLVYKGGDLESLEKNIPYFIHKEFNLKDTQVFQIEQSCASTLLTIHLAKSLIENGSAKRVLLLSGNIIVKFKKRLMSLFSVSDGAGVAEISSSEISTGNEDWEVVDFLGATDGTLSTIEDISRGGEKIVDIGVDLIKKILERNQLGVNDLSLIIPQNTNFSGWNLYCEKLGMPVEKVFRKNFGGIGHVGDVDTVRNLKDATLANEFKKGEYVLLYAVGTGASWDALLLKKV